MEKLFVRINLIQSYTEGFAAGSHYSHKGGSVELLCLPREPVWGDFNAASSGGDYLYGTEIEISAENSKMMFGENLHNQNVPCAVCQSVGRITSLRIPGMSIYFYDDSGHMYPYIVCSFDKK